jgi:hypothetical protein
MLFSLGASLPLVATRVFHAGGGGYGLMMAVFGLGALVGALLAAMGGGAPAGRQVRLLAVATGVSILATGAGPGGKPGVLSRRGRPSLRGVTSRPAGP